MHTNRRNDRISHRPFDGLGALALALLLVAGFACRTTGPTPPAPAPAPAPAPETSPAPTTEPPAADEPAPVGQSDAAIHDRVHAALEAAPDLDGTDISVRVENGRVYLGGHVHTAEQREIAHNVAHAVEGVSRVFTDDIQIR